MGHESNSNRLATVLDETTARSVATILQGLATPSRVRIITALEAGPMSVGEIVGTLGMEQSAVSHQLRHLRDLGLIVADREGRSVIYRLFDSHVLEIIEQGLNHAEHLLLKDPPDLG